MMSKLVAELDDTTALAGTYNVVLQSYGIEWSSSKANWDSEVPRPQPKVTAVQHVSSAKHDTRLLHLIPEGHRHHR